MRKHIFHHSKQGEFGNAPFVIQRTYLPRGFKALIKPLFLNGKILAHDIDLPGNGHQVFLGKRVAHQAAKGEGNVGDQFLLMGFGNHTDTLQGSVEKVGVELGGQGGKLGFLQLHFLVKQLLGEAVDPAGHLVEGKNKVTDLIPGDFPRKYRNFVLLLTVHVIGQADDFPVHPKLQQENHETGEEQYAEGEYQADDKRPVTEQGVRVGLHAAYGKSPAAQRVA